MVVDLLLKPPEPSQRVSYRGLRDGLFVLTVLLAYIPLLLHYFYPPAERTLLSDAGNIVEVLLILAWGFTGSVWIVDAKRKQDEQARAYEEKVQELQHTFENLVAYYPHGILIFDCEGNLLQANPAAYRLLGQGFATGYNILHDTAWQDEERAKALCEALAGKTVTLQPRQSQTRTEDGNVVLRTTLFPLFNEKKAITHLVVLHEDVSEQQSLEEQLLHAQKMESVGTLAGGIAHDFNNILQGILGNVSLMKLRQKDLGTLSRYVDSIEQSARRAATLTGQLLAFVRSAPHTMKPVNLNHCVEASLKLLGPGLGKNIQVRTRLAENLLMIEGDAAQIEQALMNLCLNARDAMPQGGALTIATENISEENAGAVSFSVRRLIKKNRHLVALTVRDTGTGMDAATRQRMFEPFFTTKPLGKGTGLGASILYFIVQKHNGHIELTSVPEQGTIFWLYFPATDKKVSPVKDSVSAGSWHGQEQILLVDDEEEVLETAKEGLSYLGYRVLTAKDGIEAIEIFRQHHATIDVVVLDMIMPHADGLTALRDIFKIRPDTKVILSSGYSQSVPIQSALSAGAKRLIQKPYTADELAAVIREVLEGRRLDKASTTA